MSSLASRLTGLVVVAALTLSGCSSDSEPKADPTTSASSPSATISASEAPPYLPVPEGVSLTLPGTELSVGDSAVVAYEPRQDVVAALDITVTGLTKTTFAESFKGWRLDPVSRRATPYFVRARLENVGDSSLGGRLVPLYIVDGKNTLIEASKFASTFAPCPSKGLPKKFEPGAKTKVCLVYLSPEKGELTAVSFRPTQEFNPITWIGEVTKLKKDKKDKKKNAKKNKKQDAKKKS